MTLDEIRTLLTTASAADERVVNTPERAVAWLPLLETLTLQAAIEALYAHLRASDRAVRPSDLLYLAGAQRPAAVQDDPFQEVLAAAEYGMSPAEEMAARKMLARGESPQDIVIAWRQSQRAVGMRRG
jgi:hypothetical protein